jgi:hypothetical protein
MKGMVASLVAIVLLSLVAICPLPACAMALAQHGCCHKSQAQPHCPMPTLQDCPYFILEKGKTAPTIANFVPVLCRQPASDLWAPNSFSTIRTEARLPDSAGLYLRVRVLLI